MNEKTIRFGRSQHLVGTVTRPVSGDASAPPRVIALLTNAGVISRIGPRRINVRIARRLAALGIPSIRWDLSGLGDSGRALTGGTAAEEFLRDTADAMQVASTLFRVDAFVMIGFCSGAHVAFRTALRDERLKYLVLFDHYKYPTRRTMFNWAMRRCRTLGPWKLLSTAFRGISLRVGELATRKAWKEVADPQNEGMTKLSRAEYKSLVQTMLNRGAEILFVYSGGFPRLFNYEDQFKDVFGDFGLPGRVRSEYLPLADHLVTSAAQQERLVELIVDWVHARAGMPAREAAILVDGMLEALPGDEAVGEASAGVETTTCDRSHVA